MAEHDDTTETPDDESADDAPEAPQHELLHDCIVAESLGQTVVHPTREQYLDLLKALADDGYAMIVDLCGVDYLDHMSRPLPAGVTAERFEVVVNLLDITNRRRIRVRVSEHTHVLEASERHPELLDIRVIVAKTRDRVGPAGFGQAHRARRTR